jgi:hypothetical protein
VHEETASPDDIIWLDNNFNCMYVHNLVTSGLFYMNKILEGGGVKHVDDIRCTCGESLNIPYHYNIVQTISAKCNANNIDMQHLVNKD